MKKKTKTIYRTHPVYKAAVVMLMLVTAFAVFGGYISLKSAERKGAEYESLRGRAAFEAYLTLCESVDAVIRDSGGAYARVGADAAARIGLFSDLGSEALTEYVAGLEREPDGAYALAVILDPEREDWQGAVREAMELAERRAAKSGGVVTGKDGEWRLLRERREVKAAEAREVARRAIGGGVTLTAAENHGFPLLYSFVCENAAADVTRMGGRLYRMWIYRIGDAEEWGLPECRRSAVAFVRDAGIKDVTLTGETVGDDSVAYVFSREADGDCKVLMTVEKRGGKVSFFDAEAYYRYG